MSTWDSQFLLGGELRELAKLGEVEAALLGDGVFTTLAWRSGGPEFWEAHWSRLCAHSEALDLHLEKSQGSGQTRSQIQELLAANDREEGRVKLCVLPGDPVRVWILTGPLPELHPRIRLRTSPFRINEHSPLAGIKSLSYGEYRRIHPDGSRSGTEVILANTAGNLCEGTYSNVFVVREGTLQTPPLSVGCLPGVTRQRVLDHCREHGISCVEEELAYCELHRAEEVFVTSSLQGLQVGVELDGKPLRTELATQLQQELVSA